MSWYYFNSELATSSSKDYSWRVTEAVNKDLSYSWVVYGGVSSDLSFSWNILGVISQNLSYNWKVLNAASRDFSYLWNIATYYGASSPKYTLTKEAQTKEFYPDDKELFYDIQREFLDEIFFIADGSWVADGVWPADIIIQNDFVVPLYTGSTIISCYLADASWYANSSIYAGCTISAPKYIFKL